jgi:hypothetical protein
MDTRLVGAPTPALPRKREREYTACCVIFAHSDRASQLALFFPETAGYYHPAVAAT